MTICVGVSKRVPLSLQILLDTARSGDSSATERTSETMSQVVSTGNTVLFSKSQNPTQKQFVKMRARTASSAVQN